MPRRTRQEVVDAALAGATVERAELTRSEPHTVSEAAFAVDFGVVPSGGIITVTQDGPVRALPVRRRCGTRHARGVYVEGLVSGTFDACLFDPPLTVGEVGAVAWFQPHRSPLTFERDGVTHFVVWVGEEYYPHVHDFIEEVRAAGASRKLPPHFDFARVTDRSRMFFVHPRARVRVENQQGDVLLGTAFNGPVVPEMEPNRLAAALYDARATEVDDEGSGQASRLLPCGHAYDVRVPPADARVVAEPGLFMQLGITGVALVNDAQGAFPAEVEQRVRRARVPVFRSSH